MRKKTNKKANKDLLNSRLATIVRRPEAPLPESASPKKARRIITRRSTRNPSFKNARIRLRDGSFIPCVMADFDDSGAQLRFACSIALPELVDILIPELGFKRKAELRWQNNRIAGFSFVADEA